MSQGLSLAINWSHGNVPFWNIQNKIYHVWVVDISAIFKLSDADKLFKLVAYFSEKTWSHQLPAQH